MGGTPAARALLSWCMYLIFEHILIVLGVMAVALSMVLALQNRRTPQSSAAWILFIILLPYIAVPVFLMLGFRKRGRRRLIRFHQPEASASAPRTLVPQALADTFAALGAAPALAGNHLVLHDTPEAARAALNATIDSADLRIDVLLYVLARDGSGRAFLNRLTDQARRGVTVRLGLDWLGTLSHPRRELAAFRAAGGQVHYFSPLLHLSRREQLNLRNHRKLVLADGVRVWSGGRNVGDDYLASAPGEWSDLSFTLTGPAVQGFADLFTTDWPAPEQVAPDLPAAEATPVPVEPTGAALVQLVASGPDERLDVLHDGLVNAIHRADARVWIATPYFVPTEALAQALCLAARRGVDVRILLPARSNQWTTDLARGAYLREAARAGCKIRLFTPGMMHGKAGLIDAAGWVGSANFDVRSMLLNFEMALMVYDPQSIAALADWFAGIEADCIDGPRPAHRLRRLVEAIFRLGAPIL